MPSGALDLNVIAGSGVTEGVNSDYGVYVLNELEVTYVTIGVGERRVTIALEPDGSTREGIRVTSTVTTRGAARFNPRSAADAGPSPSVR